MKFLFIFLLFFFTFPSPLFAEDASTPITPTEKRGLFSTMDSIQNQKIQITELQ